MHGLVARNSKDIWFNGQGGPMSKSMKRREFLGLAAGAALISAPTISFAQPATGKKLRIVVIANRNHEADGLMAALSNQMAHSPNLSAPYDVDWPRWPRVQTDPPAPPKHSGKPRCLINVFKASSDKVPAAAMEIWCIDDLANTNGDSDAKKKAMEKITHYTKPHFGCNPA